MFTVAMGTLWSQPQQKTIEAMKDFDDLVWSEDPILITKVQHILCYHNITHSENLILTMKEKESEQLLISNFYKKQNHKKMELFYNWKAFRYKMLVCYLEMIT